MRRILLVAAALACCTQSARAQGIPNSGMKNGTLSSGLCLKLTHSTGAAGQKWCPDGTTNASRWTNAAGTTLMTLSSGGTLTPAAISMATNTPINLNASGTTQIMDVAGDMRLSVGSGASYLFRVDSSTKFDLDGTSATLSVDLHMGGFEAWVKSVKPDTSATTMSVEGRQPDSAGVTLINLGNGQTTLSAANDRYIWKAYRGHETGEVANLTAAGRFNGDSFTSNGANPATTTGFTETVTATSMVKAWALIDLDGAATYAPSVVSGQGFNMAAPSRVDADTLQVNIADDMATANYGVTVTCYSRAWTPAIMSRAAGSFTVDFYVGGSIQTLDGTSAQCTVVVYGTQ